jgi:CSLREA domain-containing protein
MKRARRRLGVFVVLLLGVPGVAQAATITVTTTQDVIAKDGVCSLREAVISANTDSAAASGGDCVAGSGDDTIVLPAGTYRLTLRGNEDNSLSPLDNDATVNDLDVTSDATIEGAGAASTIIDANAIDRAFDGYANLQLEDLTITGGRAQNTGVNRSDDGGGVRAAANLVLTDCVFLDDQAAAGMPGASATGAAGGGLALGGIGSPGGDGGAVYAEGGLTVTGTRFENNIAGTGGASGDAEGGAGTVSSTSMAVDGGGAGTFAGGTGGDGGAIWAGTGAAITGSTFVGNSAGAGGGGGSATGGAGGAYVNLATNPAAVAGTGGGALSGAGGDGGGGGAIYVAAGTGNIVQSTFGTNSSGVGGGAGKATGGVGALVGIGSAAGGLATGNTGGVGGDGGAINSAAGAGTLTLTDSTLSGNATGAGGTGGLAVGGSAGGTDPLDNGSIAAGAAQGGLGGDAGNGGGIAVAGGATLLNVTVNGNGAGAGGAGGLATPGFGTPASAVGGFGGLGGIGGGIADVAASSQVDIRYATLSGNTFGADGAEGAPHGPGGGATLGGGGALGRSAGTISVVASIFSGNDAVGCFSAASPGSIADGGGNVRFPAADASCPGVVGDPGLGPLGDNGGPVATQAPAANGAAIDAAATAGCPATDARGAPRPVGKACDAGAYELTPPSAATGAAQGITRNGATVTATVDSHGPAGSVRFEYGPTTSYGAQLDAQPLGSGFGNRSVTATLSGVAAGTLVHYRVVVTTADGSATGADASFTTFTSAAGTSGKTPPKLSRVHLSASRFAVTSKPTAIHAGASRTSSGISLGTTVHLKLSENASVRFSIARKTTTRKGKKKIVRYTSKGAITHSFKAGSDTLAFTGWIARKPLPPGTYRVSISATDAAKNRSKVTTLTFAIVRAGTSTG